MSSGDAPDRPAPVDPRFERARAHARTRRRRRGLRRIALGLGAIAAVLGIGLGSGVIVLHPPPQDDATAPAGHAALPPEAEPTSDPETAATPAPEPERDVPRFMDLPGRPLRIDAGRVAQSAAPRRVPRPEGLCDGRGAGDVLVIRDALIPPGERVSLTLPTSQEDFAIFQAQRASAARHGNAGPLPARGARPSLRPRNVAEALALIARHEEGQATPGFSALPLIPPESRSKLYQESVLRLARSTPVDAVLMREGLPQTEAEEVAQAARDFLALDQLTAGQILALRWQGAAPERRFVQAAFYEGDRYLGALARADPLDPAATASIATGADPWIGLDLSQRLGEATTGEAAPAPGAATQPRIMDGLYAAALRQNLPPRLVGQMIMLLTAAHKLDTEAAEGDSLTLVMSAEPVPEAEQAEAPGAALDQLLYIGVESAQTPIRCYVYRPEPDAAPACYGPRDGRAATRRSVPAGTELASVGGGEGAVSRLVDRIITVESGGRADARNPLSTATGLGQFIDSTWLRMMRTYRPDLTAELSNAELLALRTEPSIAREMVENLAREGAAFLRARGHTITAGRLYLAHFLGMEGAHVALSAEPEADLLSLFGVAVIRANPFLEGRDAGYVVEWAERKMSGASGRIVVIREPDGLDAFRTAINGVLATD